MALIDLMLKTFNSTILSQISLICTKKIALSDILCLHDKITQQIPYS